MGAPLVPNPEAIELRRRAGVLRAFAARLDAAGVTGLAARAGPDVWLGPAADDCVADLTMLCNSIAISADELRARRAPSIARGVDRGRRHDARHRPAMTTYLAYDPERIGVLAASMRAALDELRGCTCDEPLASDAVGRVRHAALHLEQLWVPLLERIDRCDPLGAVDATRLDLDDAAVALARAMAERSGWQVVETDPLAVTMGAPPTAPPTVDEVRALAAVLQDGDLHHVVDTPGEQAWLAAQLTSIAADPILAAALAGGFDRWDAFADELGHVRLDLLDGRSTTADAVPATVPDSVATEVDDVDANLRGDRPHRRGGPRCRQPASPDTHDGAVRRRGARRPGRSGPDDARAAERRGAASSRHRSPAVVAGGSAPGPEVR